MTQHARTALAAAAFAVTPQLATAAVSSSWNSATSGNWANAADWSTPNYPNNGTPLGTTYDAIIAATGSAYTVTLDTSVTVGSLTLNSPGATFSQTSGAFKTSAIGIALRSGVFNQSGGTQAGYIAVGAQAGDDFTYNLTGGSLTPQLDELDVGSFGSGTFNHSGGTNATGGLYLAMAVGKSGVYNLTGSGILTPGEEYIGAVGIGVFNHFDGAMGGPGPTNQTPDFYLGNREGSSGTYNLSGTGSLTVTDDAYIGNLGAGAFVQSGSTTHSVAGDLYVSNGPSSTGTYNLGGSARLSVGGDEYSPHGTFEQQGSSVHSVGVDFWLGYRNTIARYSLSGMATLAVTGDEYLGSNTSTAIFTQSGGSHTVGGTMYMPHSDGANASYTLSGGTLLAPAAIIGATGSISQSGGSATISNLQNNGNVSMTGGSMQVQNVTGNGALLVGTGATAHVTSLRQSSVQIGGSVTIAANGGTAAANSVDTLGIDQSSGGKLDLKDNKLILTAMPLGSWNASAYTGVSGLIASAYHYGDWDAPGLTTSMPDAGPMIGITTLAISTADATFYAGSTFGGVSVSGGDVLVMYTYAGDLNLDGLVDAADYGIIDNWVQFPGTSGYANGDINYDGVIDAGDYGIIDNTIQLQGPPIPVNGVALGLGEVTAVPEPAALSALTLATGALLTRRTRRRR